MAQGFDRDVVLERNRGHNRGVPGGNVNRSATFEQSRKTSASRPSANRPMPAV
jgi:hypothetical protein